MYLPEIRKVNVTRYVTPLREGGSLPAIVEADDGFLYVLKFRGAGQGPKALIAELIGGEIARVLGLKMPELVFAELDDSFSKTEPDEEIQDLLKEYLHEKDKQTLNPHITIQHKVTEFKASQVFEKLSADFKSFVCYGSGLSTFMYNKGPWIHFADYDFTE